MQNLKYLEKIVEDANSFGIILNKYAVKKTEHVQLKIALSILEFFNFGNFVNENDVKKINNTFYIPKEKVNQFKLKTL